MSLRQYPGDEEGLDTHLPLDELLLGNELGAEVGEVTYSSPLSLRSSGEWYHPPTSHRSSVLLRLASEDDIAFTGDDMILLVI
jgi:hypothetical protein